jgi:LysM repeat protein
MQTAKWLLKFSVLTLGLAASLSGLAETPAQVQQRLEQYREWEAGAARRKALEEQEAELRRARTRRWQEQRRLEEYARRWKRYGDEEIDVLTWQKQKDGTWTTSFKEVRRQQASRESEEPARIKFGDTLLTIAQRYNLTLSELLRLNPGLQAAGLVAGTQIRVAQSNPGRGRLVLGLKPTAAGGLSWPDETELQATPRRFNQSLDELVRQGIISSHERNLMLDKSNNAQALVGVNCTSLMVNRKYPHDNWGDWVRPSAGSADEQLVIDRCATTTP